MKQKELITDVSFKLVDVNRTSPKSIIVNERIYIYAFADTMIVVRNRI